MSVVNVETDEEFQQLIKKHETCLVDFTATWCGPCRMISPFVDQQVELFSKIKFLKVDVDQLENVAKSANVRAMPTFCIYKKGVIQKSEIICGANRENILNLIKRNLPKEEEVAKEPEKVESSNKRKKSSDESEAKLFAAANEQDKPFVIKDSKKQVGQTTKVATKSKPKNKKKRSRTNKNK